MAKPAWVLLTVGVIVPLLLWVLAEQPGSLELVQVLLGDGVAPLQVGSPWYWQVAEVDGVLPLHMSNCPVCWS